MTALFGDPGKEARKAQQRAQENYIRMQQEEEAAAKKRKMEAEAAAKKRFRAKPRSTIHTSPLGIQANGEKGATLLGGYG